MVIKKDPRAILELLNKPVDVDEDEFLDKMDANKSFMLAPDHPPESLDANAKLSEQHEDMLGGLADAQVDEEDLGPAIPTTAFAGPVELTKKENKFFSLFKGRSSRGEDQASVPEGVDLNAVHPAEEGTALPRVGLTDEEKEAVEEDKARRDAYIAEYAKQEERKKSDLYNKSHDKFLGVFRDAKSKE